VRAYRDADFNAFAVATGNLCVNTGALLRMRNEAELDSVLGHEDGHVLGYHMYHGAVNAKTLGALGTVLSAGITLAIGFDPAFGAPAAYSSMAGFSRDYQREADRFGFDRSARVGYGP
jgi:predicted Zn-dependent protease